MTRSNAFTGVVARAQAAAAWWQRTRPGRANARFGSAGGGVLSGGIAYSALFSLFAALTIGFTILMAVLGGNDALRQRVIDTLAASLPGLIDTGDGQGLVQPSDLVLTVGLNVTGLIAVVVLLVSATGCMASLRAAVRAMFGASGLPSNAVFGKLRELAGLAGMAVAVLVSAVLTVAVTSAADWLLGLAGLSDGTGLLVQVLGTAVAFVVDGATFALIVVVLAGLRPPGRDLVAGSLIAAVGIGAVRLLGTSVVAGSAGKNALLASFAVIVTLLVWVNLLARIVLLAAAWTADPPAVTSPAAKPAAPAPAAQPTP
jgi:membrane protein